VKLVRQLLIMARNIEIKQQIKVLFVCIGNIFCANYYFMQLEIIISKHISNVLKGNSCRSPMAAAVLNSLVQTTPDQRIKWEIDSAALADWNVGRSPEPRCLEVLKENNLTSDHIGRKVCL
jgi:protein-tyrosine-phosphatase